MARLVPSLALLFILIANPSLAQYGELVCAEPKKEEIKSCGLKPEAAPPTAGIAELAAQCEEEAQYEILGQIRTRLHSIKAERSTLIKSLDDATSRYNKKYSLLNPTEEEKEVIKNVMAEMASLEAEIESLRNDRKEASKKYQNEIDPDLKKQYYSEYQSFNDKETNLLLKHNSLSASIGLKTAPLTYTVIKDELKPQVAEALKKSIEKFKNYKAQLEDNSKSESELKSLFFEIQGFSALENQKLELVAKGETLPCGLTPVEYRMIYEYTGSVYTDINSVLRKGPKDPNYQTIKQRTDLINKGLDKIASYEGLVIRGADLPAGVAKKHCVGCIVKYDAFTSTSKTKGFPGGHSFVIQSKNGKYIAPIASNKNEEEVLFKPGARFKILKIGKSSGKTEYTMQEVE